MEIKVDPQSSAALLSEPKPRDRMSAVNMLDVNFLFASLVWGSIGVGYFIYGKKQQSIVPLIGGILMITASYFASSALMMSMICSALVAAVYVLLRNGY